MKRSGYRSTIASLLAVLVFAIIFKPSSDQAQLIVDIGNANLAPDMPNQFVDILVNNTSGSAISVIGINVEVQVADGGPAAGGTIVGPSITDVDVITDTPFASNNDGPGGSGSSGPQVFESSTLTFSGTVPLQPGESKLARITFDTTGFHDPATWDLKLNGTVNGDTYYFDSVGNPLDPTFVAGTISVVPEPSQYSLTVSVFLGVFAAFRRLRIRPGR